MAAIDARLARIEADHGGRLLFAIESGSRAWGFPSPDSDYDCRFVFLRPARSYLSLAPQRDVIEFPLEGDIDVNGWDLRKALALALRGNAVVAEWADAPIRYANRSGFQARFRDLIREIVDPRLAARHYAGLAFAHRGRVDPVRPFALKKLFYILRPIAALLHMRDRGYESLPPMHFPTILTQIDLAADTRAAIEDLLARKATTRELGEGPMPPALAPLIEEGLALAGSLPRPKGGGRSPEDAVARADGFLLSCLSGTYGSAL